MNELYAEAAVKRTKDTKGSLLKGLIVFADIMLLVCGFLFVKSILMFLGAVAVFATIYLFPMFKTDYEYIFCDGQFDFDKIMGGSKRKTMMKVDLDNSEVLAPLGSHALDGYTYQKLEERDFTSGTKNAKIYVLVGKDDKGKMVKIKFEPNEKMLSFAKQKSPRKVMEY